MNRTCGTCKVEKPLDHSNFAWRKKSKGTYQSNCRPCQAAIRKKHYEKNKAFIYSQVKQRRTSLKLRVFQYKESLGCTDCGNHDGRVLDFDHLQDKEDNISTLLSLGRGWSTLMKEIEKCEVVCSNCHRIRTWNRQAGVV